MKTIKVSSAEGVILDWMVELALGTKWSPKGYFVYQDSNGNPIDCNPMPRFSYSTDWAQGGPILTRERISRTVDHSGLWIAYWTDGYTDGDEGKKWMHCDRSELVAGLRSFVGGELGSEVSVPVESICAI